MNSQKEVPDLFYSMSYDDFHCKGESPATTVGRIMGYIDKMAVLVLPVDLTDEAKALFVSNVTRGQTWAYHEKCRISTTASYDLIIQAFAASKRYQSDLEIGRQNRCSNSKWVNFHQSELYNIGKANELGKNDDNSDDEVFLANSPDDPYAQEDLVLALETFFGSARFAKHPIQVKPTNRTLSHVQNHFNKAKARRAHLRNSTTSSVASFRWFNCGPQKYSVATCFKPRDVERIARNITSWCKLRKMQKRRIVIFLTQSLGSAQATPSRRK